MGHMARGGEGLMKRGIFVQMFGFGLFGLDLYDGST